MLALVVITQVVVALGAGSSFSYAAPGTWSGFGGAELADTVTATQLFLALPVGVIAAAGTWLWWQNATVQ